MWESRPLPKIARKAPRTNFVRGAFFFIGVLSSSVRLVPRLRLRQRHVGSLLSSSVRLVPHLRLRQSRPLPKIARKPPSPLSAQGGLLLSALCCRACKTPPSPRIPEPALRFLPSFLPSFLLHLILNRTGWKTRRPASKTAQGAFLPLGGILSGFFAPARRFLDAILGVSCPLVLCRFRH